MDAVQNGNSNYYYLFYFVMDFDTIDGHESGDARKLENENKQPNDPPSDDYVDIMQGNSSHSRTQTKPVHFL